MLRESEEDGHSTLKALKQIYDLRVGTKSFLYLTDWKSDQLRTNYIQIFNVCSFPFFPSEMTAELFILFANN